MTMIEDHRTQTGLPIPGGHERLPRPWAGVLTGAWVLIFGLGVMLEPAPTGEEAFPLVGTVFVLALMGCWAAMASGFIRGRRSGAVASAAGGGVLLLMAIACPVSGHHDGVSAWWAFQLAGALALVGLSRAALLSR